LVLRADELQWAKVSFGMSDVRVGLGVGPDVKGSGTTSLNVTVKDVEKARAVLESRGVKFPKPTIVIPGVVKLADFADPDGNQIRLAQGLAGDSD
jgi:predicted enzyme related to lactoylglutathione lyase